MTMLTHSRGRTPTDYTSERRDPVGADRAHAHLARIKRICARALLGLLVGVTATAIMALKSAVYLLRVHN
jgi:hypothetical protein